MFHLTATGFFDNSSIYRSSTVFTASPQSPMPNIQFYQPARLFSPTSKRPPPSSHEEAMIWYLWYLNIQMFLIMTFIVLGLLHMCRGYMRRRRNFERRLRLTQRHLVPPATSSSSPTTSNPTGQPGENQPTTPRLGLRIEISINNVVVETLPSTNTVRTPSSVRDIRFGEAGNPAPIQEPSPDRVTMPTSNPSSLIRRPNRDGASAPTSEDLPSLPEPKLRGGYLSRRLRSKEEEMNQENPFRPRRDFLDIEIRLLAVSREFEQLQGLGNRGVLGDRIVGNERTRVIHQCHELRRRLDRVMRSVGFEPDDLEPRFVLDAEE